MPLPSLVVPTYELILPSTEKPIKFRPFIVKEEKLLLLALESESNIEITNAIITIISNCVLTKGIKVETLPTFDIEFLFLNIRKKSVGETIDLTVFCPDDGVTEVKIQIDLDEVQVQKDPNHTKNIKIGDKFVLEMKYPSLDQFIKNNFDLEKISSSQTYDMIIDCVDKLCVEDEVYVFSDYSRDEWVTFFDELTSTEFNKIQSFFETMPKLRHEVEVTNPVTKVTEKIVLEGLTAFFTSQ
jgi:hypothetical protein